MSFYTYARLIRRSDLSFHRRRSAFRSCIQIYCWLIKQKFETTYVRFSERYKFDVNGEEAGERLNEAMNVLETERNLFLEQLRLFDKKRVREKTRGRRSPSKTTVDALYRNMKFLT